MKKIVLVGGGGHCKIIIDLLRTIGEYQIVGITDQRTDEKEVLGVPVIGDDHLLAAVYKSGVKLAFISLGAISNLAMRKALYEKVKKIGFQFPVLAHPAALVSPYARIGAGTCLMVGAIINAGAKVGENSIVNTGAIVEHDCMVGNNVQIAPGAILAGKVEIKDNTFIGMGSMIKQEITIGENTVIGAGAVVTKDIPDHSVAYGVPARVKK